MQRASRSLPFLLTRALFSEDPGAVSGGSPTPWGWKRFTISSFVSGMGRTKPSVALSRTLGFLISKLISLTFAGFICRINA